MASEPGRDYAASLAALNSTQLHGDSLRRAYGARRDTVKAMNVYLQRLGLADGVATLPTLHVTGTKGKGSTCAFVEAVLRRQGVRTVLFTSPHLVRVNERIRLDGQPLTDTQWSHHFWAVWNRLQQAAPSPVPLPMKPATHLSVAAPIHEAEPEAVPGYFRFLTLLCFWVAVHERADVLILEVGVGGRFDATNVVPRPVACAITTLDLEHTDLLGSTIEEIAWEKGGIIKPGIPCFVGPQPPRHAASALRVLRTCALEAPGAALHFVKPLPAEIKLGIAGDFQAMNAALALALVQHYHSSISSPSQRSPLSLSPAPETRPQDSINNGVDEEEAAEAWVDITPYLLSHEPTVREGVGACAWPGRCQRLEWGPTCTFSIDGAHTEESMRTAVEWFDGEASPRARPRVGVRRRVLIFNCGEEKTVPDLLAHLLLVGVDNGKGAAASDYAAPRFDVVFFCPVASAKPTLAHARPARVLLLEEGEGEEEGGDAYAHRLDQGRLRALCDALELEVEVSREVNDAKTTEKEEEEGGGMLAVGPGPSLQWQRALRDTWRVLQAYHMQEQEQQQQQEKEETEGAEQGPTSWLARADRETRTVVLPSVTAALEEIKAMMAVEPLEVLVTGSLYLVGNVLGRVEEEPSPKFASPPSSSSSSSA